jgi:hypothetical protein
MKTIYTLLLAFGLCLTVHAQSNSIYTLSEKQLNLNESEFLILKDNLDGATPALTFTNDFYYISYATPSNQVEKITLENRYEISKVDTQDITYNLDLVKILKLNWKSGKSFNLAKEFLNKLTNVEYVYLKMLLANIMSELNQSVQVIYNVAHGG